MSRLGAALALGGAAIIGAWSLGSAVAAVAGVTVLLAAAGGALWRRRARRVLRVHRDALPTRLVEGDTLRYGVALTRPLLPGTFSLEETVSRVGRVTVGLPSRGRCEARVDEIPRGRITIGPSVVEAEDPLGLVRLRVAVSEIGEIVVRPRLPRLGSLSTDGAGRLRTGAGAAVRQPTGTDLHGVREYRAGEPMRSVHWISTARRGELMVRELEEPAAEDVVVVLDLDGRAEVGPPGRSSLDEAVRAAGALVVAHGDRGRTVRLVVSGTETQSLTVRTTGDREAMLDVLALARPRAGGRWTALRGRHGTPVVLVTARIENAVRGAERLDAVVLVDAASYAVPARSTETAPLLGLTTRGTIVTIVRAGDDLPAALSGGLGRTAAVG